MIGRIALWVVLAGSLALAAGWQEVPGGPPRPGAGRQPAPRPPVTDRTSGDLRIEMDAILEQRIRFEGDVPQNAPGSALRMRLRVVGDGCTRIARVGTFLIDELTDDRDNKLFDTSTITDAQRTNTSPVNIGPDDLKGGLPLMIEATCAGRESKSVKHLNGKVNLVMADGTTWIPILNPKQYEGQSIPDPRLQASGIDIHIMKPGEETDEKPETKGLGFRIVQGQDAFVTATLTDADMRNLNSRFRDKQAKDGSTYQQHTLAASEVDASTFLVLKIYTNVTRKTLEAKLENIALP